MKFSELKVFKTKTLKGMRGTHTQIHYREVSFSLKTQEFSIA